MVRAGNRPLRLLKNPVQQSLVQAQAHRLSRRSFRRPRPRPRDRRCILCLSRLLYRLHNITIRIINRNKHMHSLQRTRFLRLISRRQLPWMMRRHTFGVPLGHFQIHLNIILRSPIHLVLRIPVTIAVASTAPPTLEIRMPVSPQTGGGTWSTTTTSKAANPLMSKFTSTRWGCMIRLPACMFLSVRVRFKFLSCTPCLSIHVYWASCLLRLVSLCPSPFSLLSSVLFTSRVDPSLTCFPIAAHGASFAIFRIYFSLFSLYHSFYAHIFMDSRSFSSFHPGDASSNSGHLQPPSQGRGQVLEESPILPASSHFPSHNHQQPQGGSVSSPKLSSGLRVTNSKLTDNNSNKTLSHLPLSPKPVTPNPHSQPQQQQNPVHINQARSPQLPPAPIRSTIPLPQMDEGEYRGDTDAHQLQHLHRHQQMHAHEHQTVVHGAPIDLSGLSLNSSMHAPRQHQQHSLGLTSSQSQPMLSVNTSFDPNSPCSPSPTSGFPTSNSDSALASMGQKTPNVYINGLPPHFPEDQLFALASPFGEIRSVRTFTRHVRDSESGYGFVLSVHVFLPHFPILSLIMRLSLGSRRLRPPRNVSSP